ncbi:unnamed protein product [Oikopleura dioica]|uniref:RING-type domain-containing protein n=1 Tax=Oikopleura dioica TaxID=34765 RepID=E4XA72_OIKDI|nr:unnamed protein product [Oikopleura dioica]
MALTDIPSAVLNEQITSTTPRSSVESNSSSTSEVSEAGVSEQLRRFQSVFKVQMGHLSTAVDFGKRQTEKEILLLRSKLEDAQLNERRTQTLLSAALRRESALEKELTKLEDQIDQQNSLLDVSRDATDENLNLRLQLDELKLEHTRLAAFEKLGICSICVESFDDSEKKMSALSVCGHMLCSTCASKGNTCPHCRIEFSASDVLHLFPS